MSKISKRKLVVKNFKYMFPLLLKKSPQTIILSQNFVDDNR